MTDEQRTAIRIMQNHRLTAEQALLAKDWDCATTLRHWNEYKAARNAFTAQMPKWDSRKGITQGL